MTNRKYSFKAKQDWAIGNIVKVGFLTLKVLEKIATPGNYLPDQFVLQSTDGSKVYRFVPHNGLSRMDSIEDARIPA